jgi:hypothetical protein
MEVTYRMTREDCHHLAGLVWTRVVEQAGRVSGWRANPGVLSAGSILLTLLLLASLRAAGVIDDIGAMVAAFVYLWGLWSMKLCEGFWRRQFWQHMGDNSPMLARSHLRLSGDGIELIRADTATRYGWQGIKEISDAGNLTVIWLDRADGIAVPKEAFANEEARERFVAIIREQIARASA